jgi:hypothetical protein
MVAGLMTSHTLAVNVVCHKGVASAGRLVIPLTTVHPAEQVSVAAELCPAVSTCDDDRYQNTVPFALVPVRVPVTGVVIVNTTGPIRILQGVALLQPAEVLLAAKSPSCDALPTPSILLHVFVEVQPYMFWPAGAFVLKNASARLQEGGITVPAFAGLVEMAPEKSTFFDWTARSTWVWPSATVMAANRNIINLAANIVDLAIRRDCFVLFIVVHHHRL